MRSLLRDSAPSPVPKPTFYTVPAGAQSTKCRGATCDATIYFIRSPKTGRPLPVHCDVEGGERPSDTADPSQLDMLAGEAAVHHGRGVSHFADCPDVEQFTRGAR
jgi:hypothetical protein